MVMATKTAAKAKAVVHPKVEQSNWSLQKQQTGSEITPSTIVNSMQEKPIPNYLRPTLSSCGITSCNYPTKQKQQQHSDDSSPQPQPQPQPQPFVITKRPIRISSYPSSSQFKVKDTHKSHKKNTISATTSMPLPQQKQSISLKHTSDRSPRKSAFSVSNGGSRGRPQLPAAAKKRNPTKRREDNGIAEEKVILVDTVGCDIVITSSPPKTRKEVDMLHCEGGEHGGEVKNLSSKHNNNINNNEVIEEEARKLAERRNKVKALVGAFETVISLHEPEVGQQNPEKGDDEVKDSQQEEDEGQQSQQQLGEENVDQEVAKEGGEKYEEEKVDDGQQSPQEVKVEEGLTDELIENVHTELTGSTEEGNNNEEEEEEEEPSEKIVGVAEENDVNPKELE